MQRISALAEYCARCRPAATDFGILCAAAVILMLPSLVGGPPNGHSYALNAVWIEQFTAQAGLSDPYPRWIGGFWGGAGGADFFFYAPLPFWVAALLQNLACRGCGTDQILVLSGVLWLALSGIAFRALAGRFAGRWAAIGGALAYMALPYHLGADWSDRQALAEFAAAALLPLHLAAFLDSARGPGAGPRLALLSGLIALCHLPTALILSLGYAALLFAVPREPGLRCLGRIALAAGLGLGLSAVYWLPAVTELDGVFVAFMRGGDYHWSNWFLSAGARGWAVPFFAGLWLPFAALALACLASTLFLRGQAPVAARVALVLIAVVLVMVTPISLPLWLYTPISAIQFPWRFLMLADLAFGLAAMLAIAALTARPVSRIRGLASGAVLAAIALTSVVEHPALRTGRGAVDSPGPSIAYATGALEWLPVEFDAAILAPGLKAFNARVHMLPSLPEVAAMPEGTPAGSLRGGTARRQVYAVDLAEPATVVFLRTYWRHWRLTDAATGQATPLSATEGFPLIAAQLPAGRADYILDLPPLRSETLGRWLALASLLLIAGWAALSRRPTGSAAGRSRAAACAGSPGDSR